MKLIHIFIYPMKNQLKVFHQIIDIFWFISYFKSEKINT